MSDRESVDVFCDQSTSFENLYFLSLTTKIMYHVFGSSVQWRGFLTLLFFKKGLQYRGKMWYCIG